MTRFALILAGSMLASLATPAWAQDTDETNEEEAPPAQPATYAPATTDAAREKAKLDKLWLERNGTAQPTTGTTSTTTTSSGGTTTIVKTVRGALSDADLARIQAAKDAATRSEASAVRSEGSAVRSETAAGKAEDAATRAEKAAQRAETAASESDATDSDSREEDEDWADDEDAEDEDEPAAADERDEDLEDEEPTRTIRRQAGEKEGRGSVFLGASGGVAFNGAPITDASGVAVAGPVSAPFQAWGGWLYTEYGTEEHRGVGLGVVAHGGVDPINMGTTVGAGFAAMSLNQKGGGYGVSAGYAYVGFQSLDSGANAWLHGGEVLGHARMVLGRADADVVTDLFAYAGVQAGVLANEEASVFGAFPVAGGGIQFRFGGSRLATVEEDDE